MKADERTITDVLHSPNRHTVPVYQRGYTWSKKQWEKLWHDIVGVMNGPPGRQHFIGALVALGSEVRAGQQINTFTVIDGQQRLITLSILLAAIRDAAIKSKYNEFAQKVDDYYLIHQREKGERKYKIWPREIDRGFYLGIIDKQPLPASSLINGAYKYFAGQIKKLNEKISEADLESLMEACTARLDIVVITLGLAENPLKIFKSLNSTGTDLGDGDLIRNHVFMSLPEESNQEDFDLTYWRPLEANFNEDNRLDAQGFEGFFRDFMMMSGTHVLQRSVYEDFEAKFRIGHFDPSDLVDQFKRAAPAFNLARGKLVHDTSQINSALGQIRRLRQRTTHPLVMTIILMHEEGALSDDHAALALRCISGFILRRYVCDRMSSRQYGFWFAEACKSLREEGLIGLLTFFRVKGWPDDEQFIGNLVNSNIYEGDYGRPILDELELALQQLRPAERVSLEGSTIEHIMPQTIGDDNDPDALSWQAACGEHWEQTHAEWVHTIGNLTIIGKDYNNAMKNSAYARKSSELRRSKLSLNEYFQSHDTWDIDCIRERGAYLAKSVASQWQGPLELAVAAAPIKGRVRRAAEVG